MTASRDGLKLHMPLHHLIETYLSMNKLNLIIILMSIGHFTLRFNHRSQNKVAGMCWMLSGMTLRESDPMLRGEEHCIRYFTELASQPIHL